MTVTATFEAKAVQAGRAGISAEEAAFFAAKGCPARADALTAEAGVKIA